MWREARDRLFATHPDSPILAEDRASFRGLTYAPYDPALRWELPVDLDVEPQRRDVPTGTDGVVPFERVGRVHLPDDRGSLDVWWLEATAAGCSCPSRTPRRVARRTAAAAT